VRKERHNYEFACEKRSGFPVYTAISVFVLCAVGFSFLFLNFTPDLPNQVQLSHNVPPVSDLADQEPANEATQGEPAWRDDDQTLGGTQEIADITGPGETIFSLMYANMLDESVARRVALELARAVRPAAKKGFDAYSALPPGTRYSIALDQKGAFQKVTLELDPSRIFHCEAQGNGIRSWKEDVVVDFKTERLRLRVSGTLMKTVLDAGESKELARELHNVFKWDIDFQSDSMRGDVCTLLFERRYFDDRPSGYGRILSAMYEGKKTGRKTAVLFNGQYYSEDGKQLKKNFLRSPLTVVRVTSRYGMRFHPILRKWRQHCGVDYGAAAGTPVLAVATGVVVFSGWNNSYGNYVCIKHDSGYESRYGHLSRAFMHKGERVKQGQRVGLVGQTGIATGPHLDFQLLVRGKHVNPLSVKMVQTVRSVPAPLKTRFKQVADQTFAALDRTLSAPAAVSTELVSAR
jgi:murein DD-endopeptidase MepM/ murein hydrolase activator NlpD